MDMHAHEAEKEAWLCIDYYLHTFELEEPVSHMIALPLTRAGREAYLGAHMPSDIMPITPLVKNFLAENSIPLERISLMSLAESADGGET
ncbi:MAG TPA: hypothetical protein VHB73_02445, partial [Alphaproteobacteria bacterium]|nr:hypothetical protein [Alphaproteobacteria bacterium]